MKKLRIVTYSAVALLAAFVAVPNSAIAETFKKLHSAPQVIISFPAATTTLNDVNDATTGVSSTVDLSGGDLDKVSFGISLSSGSGIGTSTLAAQVTADGGVTWLTAYNISFSTNGLTAVTTTYTNIPTGPGTKLRIVPTLTANTSYYGFKMWALPSAD